jgi:hypothetical protein
MSDFTSDDKAASPRCWANDHDRSLAAVVAGASSLECPRLPRRSSRRRSGLNGAASVAAAGRLMPTNGRWAGMV